MTFKLL